MSNTNTKYYLFFQTGSCNDGDCTVVFEPHDTLSQAQEAKQKYLKDYACRGLWDAKDVVIIEGVKIDDPTIA